MNSLTGLFYYDFRPFPREDEHWVRYSASSRYLPPVWHGAPGLRMAQAASRLGSKTSSGHAESCFWDGRLDNRAELIAKFGSTTLDSDAALALRAYEAEGARGFRWLVGDWSLALWDAHARALLLASDYAGVRPLYYASDAHGVRWASSLAWLAGRDGAGDLDDRFVEGFLLHGHAPNSTPYRGIKPVPPGHALRFCREGVSTTRFWTLPVEREIRFDDPREYEEGLRGHFRDAVSSRLRSDLPVCAELSGGLDSSSVVCMATRLGASLETFSYTHENCPDERYFRAVERACNLSGTHLDLANYPLVAPGETGNAAPAWWQPRLTKLAERMDSIGSGTLLSGQFGDFVMGNALNDSDQAADYFRARQWRQGAGEALAWSRSLQMPVYPILARTLRMAFSSWTPAADSEMASAVSNEHSVVDSLAPSFRKRLGGIAAAEDQQWKSAAPGRRRRFRALQQMFDARVLQTPEALQHLAFAHPFAHRPLVEFMLSIPPGEICRPGEPRRLMRRAFADLLPAAVLKRRSKATYTAIYRESILPLAFDLIDRRESLCVAERGYVDAASFRGRLDRFAQGLECNESQLRQLILLEHWLRSRSGETLEQASVNDSSLLLAAR